MDNENVKNAETDAETKDVERSVRNEYHPALCNAIELELYYDRDCLEFQQSVTLNTLPREIDLLVIRKEKPSIIKNELGKIFRRCNIWEFKGYAAELNVAVYYKTMSYVYEYLSEHKELDGINDVTISFLREGRPVKLMKWLEKEGYEKKESPGWIVRYAKTGYPDLQIVNIAHPKATPLLRLISHKAEPEDVKWASEYTGRLPQEERDKARIIVELSYSVNGDMRGGMEMGGFFETYVDPLTEIIKEKDEQIEQKDEMLEQKNEMLEQKDEMLEEKDEMLEQKDAQIAELLARIAELESAKAG